MIGIYYIYRIYIEYVIIIIFLSTGAAIPIGARAMELRIDQGVVGDEHHGGHDQRGGHQTPLDLAR
jgi:hypothetical protein